MDFLDDYLTRQDEQSFSVSATQGSAFAKQVADDYNPIHHADSKRFCVPGDLLFAIALRQYGVRQNMAFQFLDLINADTRLHYPALDNKSEPGELEVTSDAGKAVLTLKYSGSCTQEAARVEQLLRQYVAFSGHNFPDILVPLMRQHDVMINPQRPLVIYQSMAFELNTVEFDALTIELAKTALQVNGKRGNAELHFVLTDGDEEIGRGIKHLVLSGLRPYQSDAIDAMCAEYAASKP
ncbi:MAG: DUF3581 family protein [Gammaproteobacteria bacterium]|nr:DUF3581 family protein [Gammaproteobacteria bacterium]